MNFDSFSHGQVLSKIWLCEQIEPFLPRDANIVNLGGWYNVLGFMLKVRNPKRNIKITNVDADPETQLISNAVTNAWKDSIRHITADANQFRIKDYNVVINCSAEHFDSAEWFDEIAPGALVCIQSSNVDDIEHPWLVKIPNPDLETFMDRYPLANTYFSNEMYFDYESWGYSRFMLIGRK